MSCECKTLDREPRLVVLTGGPGGGKTAVLEIVRRYFCVHVQILPEAAGIVFGGGFSRDPARAVRCAGQRAIFHVQRELERAANDERKATVVLCDRGTVDGLAYWPLDEASWWSDVASSEAEELARYGAVIHLRTPSFEGGYDHVNPLRIETAKEASLIDARIARAWSSHPQRAFVENEVDFLTKIGRTVALIRDQVPACCRTHRIPGVDP